MTKNWTIDEVSYLRANYKAMAVIDIAMELRRTRVAIIGKARELGLSKLWTDDEDDFIREKYPTASKGYLADKLERTWGAICHRAAKLNVRRLTAKQRTRTPA